MKFTCRQQDLSKALNIVSKAISNRTTIPILKGILLEVSQEGILKLTASDMDLSIERSIIVSSFEPGAVVVSARLFMDIVRKLPNADIEIETIGEKVSINCLASEFNIVGQEADDFPKIGITESDQSIILETATVREMIKKTSFAASIEEAKGIIVGVLLEMEEGRLSMVALDGFRMAITRESIKSNENVRIIIAARILNEINKIFSEENEKSEVKIILDEQKATFLLEETHIVLRIMEGEFIKYKDILPKEHLTKLAIKRNEMIDCLERVSLLAKEGRNNLIKLEIDESMITITSQSEEGNVKEEVFIEKEGENLEIGFNVKYLLEVFKAIQEDDVTMELNTNISPCLIKPLKGDAFEYLILPVRISARVF